MVAARENAVYFPWAQLGNVLELGLGVDRVFAEAELAVLGVATGEEVALLGEDQGVVPAGGDRDDWLGEEVFDEAGSELVLAGSVAELAVLAEAEGVELAVGGEHHAVVTAGLDLLDMALVLEGHGAFVSGIMDAEALLVQG